MAQGPSTDWRERIAPDEEARFARQAEKLAPMQAALSARYGPGRLLHRKPALAARGTLEILDGLPDVFSREPLLAFAHRRTHLGRQNHLATIRARLEPFADDRLGFAAMI